MVTTQGTWWNKRWRSFESRASARLFFLVDVFLVDVEEPVEREHQSHTQEDDERHLHARLAVDLGKQVRRSNVDGYAGREGQSGINAVAEDSHGQHTSQRCASEHD